MALDFPSSPSNGQTYTSDNIVWEYETSTTTWNLKQDVEAGTTRVAKIYEAKARNTASTSPADTAYYTRLLNTKDDPQNMVTWPAGASLGTGGTNTYFSLAAGSYKINWRASVHDGLQTRSRLQYDVGNDTFSSPVEVLGESGISDGTSPESNYYTCGTAIITVTDTTYFRIQQAQEQGTWGQPCDVGGDEIYTQVFVVDLATAVKNIGDAYVAGTSKVATVKDVKAYNNGGGGSFPADTWVHRDLNTISDPKNIGLTISGNIVTVPAGTYSMRWRAPAYWCGRFTSRLAYSTTSSTVASGITHVDGTTSYDASAANGGLSQIESFGDIASITFTSTTYLKIEQYSETGRSGTTGLGVDSNISGVDSVYTTLQIEDLETAIKKTSSLDATSKVAVLYDQKPQGTAAGTYATADGWVNRTLTAEVDPQNFVTPASGSLPASYFSLAAGTYKIKWDTPSYMMGNYQSRLQYDDNDSFSSPINVYGSTEFATTNAGVLNSMVSSDGTAVLTFTETNYIRIQVKGSATPGDANALGKAANLDTEVYTQVTIEDLATAALKQTSAGKTKVAILRDQKDYNRAGGHFYGDYWRDRDLTVKEDPQSFVNFVPTVDGQTNESAGKTPGYWSLGAGTYEIQWGAGGFDVNSHQTRLVWSTTKSDMTWSTVEPTYSTTTADNPPDETSRFGTNQCFGSSENNTNQTDSAWTGTWSTGTKVITITETTWFKVLHICEIDDADGFGTPVDSSGFSPDRYTTGKNIYAEVKITDLATAVKEDSTGAQNGVFWENDISVSKDYTITAGKNAMSAGPIEIDLGVTVTVPSGSAWTIVGP